MRFGARNFAVSTVAVCTTEFVLDGGFAEAAIVAGTFGQVGQSSSFNITIPGAFGTSSTSSASARINTGGANGFSWAYGGASLVIAQTSPGSSNDALNLSLGAEVGPTLDFGDYAQILGDFDGYVAMRFSAPGGNVFTGPYLYGWARVDFDSTSGQISILEYAYEDTPDTAITVGQIPEVSSLGLLALGAGGLTARRRRLRAS